MFLLRVACYRKSFRARLSKMGGPENPRPAPATPQPNPASTSGLKKATPEIQALMEAALGGEAARIYANGFTLGMTNADVFVVLQQFGRPIAVLSLSYTLAKTLSHKLSELVSDWEGKTKKELQTTDKIDEAFRDTR